MPVWVRVLKSEIRSKITAENRHLKRTFNSAPQGNIALPAQRIRASRIIKAP